MEILIINFYRIIYSILYILISGIYIFIPSSKLKKSLQFRFKSKFTKNPSYDPSKENICFHAASGEIEYAFPLIKKFKVHHPEYNIIVTLSSTSVLPAVGKQPLIDAYGPAPLDLSMSVRKFLMDWNPQMVLFARTDVWPEFSYQLKIMQIESYIFSCTLSDNSSRLSPISREFTKFSFNNLSKVFVVSDQDKKNLEQLNIKPPILVTGDTRFDQIALKKNIPTDLNKLQLRKNIFIAGSTWPEDEKVIFSIMNQFKNWQWIIAPHEIDENHLYQIECLIKNNLPNANVIRYSKYESEKNWDIIIVDQFGKLFYLYEFADLAFVGGSFKDKVHSVMEPLAYNKFVLVGPHFKNNREAIEFNQIKVTSSLPIVSSVKSDLEMKKVLVEIENLSPEDKASHQKKIEKMVTEKMKATDRIYELINGSDSIN